MEKLLSFLKCLPEYEILLQSIRDSEAAAVTGIGQINRNHMIAALRRDTDRPIVAICTDDSAAQRLQGELHAFLGTKPEVLPHRDLTLYDTAVVSRAWEQKRLRQLYELSTGRISLQIIPWESLCQRTMPPTVLQASAFSLTVGQEYNLASLEQSLIGAGYSRCPMVEGPGQFAVRGGILDIFSPAADRPFRAEFFGDELDAMGYFDPDTQRRTENISEALVLPVGETQPMLHPGKLEGLCNDIRNLIARQKRRKTPNEALITTLEKDLAKYENKLSNPASDRYMSLIYPTFATAFDYIPDNAIILLCDHSNIHRTSRTATEEMGMRLDSLLQSGLLAGELCDYILQWDDFAFSLKRKTVVYLDSFAGNSYPEACPPKHLLPMIAKQLPGYGGNLDTAASDLSHYQKMGFSCLVLCGTRRRAEILQEKLNESKLHTSIAIPLTALPQPGQIYLSEGTLPFGMEYPTAKLAVLTEGQLTGSNRTVKAKAKKSATNRQKLNSFTDLSPGDLVVHENYGIGRFVAMEQIKVDGAIKDYVKIAYHGSDTLYVPATQLDMVSKYIGSGGEDGNVRLNKIGTDA